MFQVLHVTISDLWLEAWITSSDHESKLASFCFDNVSLQDKSLWYVVRSIKDLNRGPQDQDPVMARPIFRPLKTSEMCSNERWMVTSHQSKLSWLNFFSKSDIKSPKCIIKDWRRAWLYAWKPLLNVRAIPPNADFSTLYSRIWSWFLCIFSRS